MVELTVLCCSCFSVSASTVGVQPSLSPARLGLGARQSSGGSSIPAPVLSSDTTRRSSGSTSSTPAVVGSVAGLPHSSSASKLNTGTVASVIPTGHASGPLKANAQLPAHSAAHGLHVDATRSVREVDAFRVEMQERWNGIVHTFDADLLDSPHTPHTPHTPTSQLPDQRHHAPPA